MESRKQDTFPNKNNEGHLPICPICCMSDRDNDHIYHCTHHTMITSQVKNPSQNMTPFRNKQNTPSNIRYDNPPPVLLDET